MSFSTAYTRLSSSSAKLGNACVHPIPVQHRVMLSALTEAAPWPQIFFVTNNATKSRAENKKKFDKMGIQCAVVRCRLGRREQERS